MSLLQTASGDPPVVPWFVHRAPARLADAIRHEGRRMEVARGERILSEFTPYGNLYYLESAVVGQCVIQNSPTKPQAMSIFTEGRILGYINALTNYPSPHQLLALTAGTVYVLPHARWAQLLEADHALALEHIRYMELCVKSELIGMEALFTLSPELKFTLMMAAHLISEGFIDAERRILRGAAPELGEEFVALPHHFTRDAVRLVTYLSRITFDRLHAELTKNGLLSRSGSRPCVDVRALEEAVVWIGRH